MNRASPTVKFASGKVKNDKTPKKIALITIPIIVG
jgi:hypothetical protein